MQKNSKQFVNDYLYRRLLHVISDSIEAGEVANALQDDVMQDIAETADPDNWHSGDIDIALSRVLKKRLLSENDEPEKLKCAVVFGSRATSRYDEQDFKGLHEVCRDGDGSIVIREFDTEAERKAFIEGIEAGDGWCDYMEVDQTDIENVTFDDI
jgi:hypothetical protein